MSVETLVEEAKEADKKVEQALRPHLPKKKKPRKQSTPRVVKPAKYEVQAYLTERICEPGTDGPFRTVNFWAKSPHGDEVKDTRSGLDWIKANGQPGERYRVVRVCEERTVKQETRTVLE